MKKINGYKMIKLVHKFSIIFYFITLIFFPYGSFAQSAPNQNSFTDTTQEILKKSRNDVLSKKRIANRNAILRKLSNECKQSNKALPPECRNFNQQDILESQQQSLNKVSSDVTKVPPTGGGISIGMATMGLTSFIAIAGGAILGILALGGYGGDSSSGAGASGAASTN